MPTKRCFIGIELDDVARADIGDAMERVHVEGIKLTRIENLHVTVKFLGDVDVPQIPRVIDAVREASSACPRFDLELTHIDYLPTVRRPRVLAAMFAPCPPAADLFAWIEEAVGPLGFPREGRAFHPHITLGRFRKPPRHIPPAKQFTIDPTTLPVEGVALMESCLNASGPQYFPLGRFPLAGGSKS